MFGTFTFIFGLCCHHVFGASTSLGGELVLLLFLQFLQLKAFVGEFLDFQNQFEKACVL